MTSPKKKCDRCEISYRCSHLSKKGLCKKCITKERREKGKMIGMTNLSIVPKHYYIIKKVKEKKVERDVLPNIKSIKKEKHTPNGGMYLSMIEKQVLYKKYRKSGLDHREADQKVKDCIQFLKEKMAELRVRGDKSYEDINLMFKERFAEMCEQV